MASNHDIILNIKAQVKDTQAKLRQLETSLKQAGGATKQLADVGGTASFAVISLGQGFQDAGQFGMGMAQGVRAVTNNAQQMVGAFVLLRDKVGSTTGAFKEFVRAMKGPVGFLLVFSLATAALEFFSTRAQRLKKDAEEADNALKNLAKTAAGFISITNIPGGIAALTGQQANVLAVGITSRIEDLREELEGLSTDIEKATEADLSRYQEVQKEIDRLIPFQEALINQAKDYNTRLMLRNTALDLGLDLQEKDREQIKKTTTALDAQFEALSRLLGAAAGIGTGEGARITGRIAQLIGGRNLMPEGFGGDSGSGPLGLPTEDDLRGPGEAISNFVDDTDRNMQRFSRTMNSAFASGVSSFVGGLAEMAIGAEKNPATALLVPMADMAINMGRILIAAGLGIEAMKNSLLSFTGVGAIVAGGALVAIGSAVKSAVKAEGERLGGRSGGLRGPSGGPTQFGSLGPRLAVAPSSSSLAVSPSGGIVQHQFVVKGNDLVTVADSARASNVRVIGR